MLYSHSLRLGDPRDHGRCLQSFLLKLHSLSLDVKKNNGPTIGSEIPRHRLEKIRIFFCVRNFLFKNHHLPVLCRFLLLSTVEISESIFH